MRIDCVFSNTVVSALLFLSLSVSPAHIPCEPKLCIEPAILSLLFGFHTCFRTLFLHGIRAQGLRTSIPDNKTRNRQTLILGEEQKESKTWTEEWVAHFRQRSSKKAIMHLGCTRSTSTCSGMATGVMSTELTIQCLMQHTRTLRLGNKCK